MKFYLCLAFMVSFQMCDIPNLTLPMLRLRLKFWKSARTSSPLVKECENTSRTIVMIYFIDFICALFMQDMQPKVLYINNRICCFSMLVKNYTDTSQCNQGFTLSGHN